MNNNLVLNNQNNYSTNLNQHVFNSNFNRYTENTLQGINNKNFLLQFATPIILLMLKIKKINNAPNVDLIYQQAINEMRQFDQISSNAGISPKIILAASYCLCVAFDEAVLATTWGQNSSWTKNTLLSAIYQETWGGERFYIVLNKMAEEPINNLDALELIYLLLTLGFEGKYFNEQQGMRDEIRYSLFNLIRNYREPPRRTLSDFVIDQKVLEHHSFKKISLRKIGFICCGIFAAVMLLININTYYNARFLFNNLKQISKANISNILEN